MSRRADANGLTAALVTIFVLGAATPARALPVEITSWTDRDTYVPGQTIRVSVDAYNPNPYDVTLNFGSTLQSKYIMDGWYEYPQMGFCVLTEAVVPAQGSYTWEYCHAWWDYDLSLGFHTISGEVVGYGESAMSYFQVAPPVLPEENFTIDFDTMPDGSEPVFTRIYKDYAAWGVHFRSTSSSSGPMPTRSDVDGDLRATINRCTYPPGFNIVADFAMPVYGIMADVCSAVGRTVTMVARDAEGNEIASVTSEPIAEGSELVGPIELNCDVPIASVEWWPSSQNSSVSVDNLRIFVTGPHIAGDLDCDGFVGQADLDAVLIAWGQYVAPRTTPADIDGDGFVGFNDLVVVLGCWGRGHPQPPGAGGQ